MAFSVRILSDGGQSISTYPKGWSAGCDWAARPQRRRAAFKPLPWSSLASRPTRSELAGTTCSPGIAVGTAASSRPYRRSARRKPSCAVLRRNAEPRRGVALRIEIDDQHALADGRECRPEIYGRRRFADAALLIGDRQGPCALSRGIPPSSHAKPDHGDSAAASVRLGSSVQSNSHRSLPRRLRLRLPCPLGKPRSLREKNGAMSSRSLGRGAKARAVITSC